MSLPVVKQPPPFQLRGQYTQSDSADRSTSRRWSEQ